MIREVEIKLRLQVVQLKMEVMRLERDNLSVGQRGGVTDDQIAEKLKLFKEREELLKEILECIV